MLLWGFSDRFPSLHVRGCEPVSLAPTHVDVSRVLRAVVFGHVVGHPVDFGCPALSQGFVKLVAKLFQCLLVRFTQSQRILTSEGSRETAGINVVGGRNRVVHVTTTTQIKTSF